MIVPWYYITMFKLRFQLSVDRLHVLMGNSGVKRDRNYFLVQKIKFVTKYAGHFVPNYWKARQK